jgi:RNase P/RNase MRP subunit POP5
MSKANPVVIEHKNGKGILSFNRKYADEIKSALVFYNIHTLGISGTIKKAKEKFLKGKV